MKGLAKDIASAILVGVILPALIIQAGILVDSDIPAPMSFEPTKATVFLLIQLPVKLSMLLMKNLKANSAIGKL